MLHGVRERINIAAKESIQPDFGKQDQDKTPVGTWSNWYFPKRRKWLNLGVEHRPRQG